jgi:hypothetical protein
MRTAIRSFTDPPGVEVLDLRQDERLEALADAVEPDEGRVADEVGD